MNQLIIDIWPYLIGALLAATGWLFREGYILKTNVAVLESELKNFRDSVIKDRDAINDNIESLQESVEKDIESIHRTIENIQKRQDSHSKKQDEIVNLITDFKLEVVKQMGEMASDLKALNRMMSVNDEGIKFNKPKKG